MREVSSENDPGFVNRPRVVIFGVPDEVPHRLDRIEFLPLALGEGGKVLKEVEDAPLSGSTIRVAGVAKDVCKRRRELMAEGVGFDLGSRIACNVAILTVEKL